MRTLEGYVPTHPRCFTMEFDTLGQRGARRTHWKILRDLARRNPIPSRTWRVPDDNEEEVDNSQGREQDLFGGRCGTRTHDLSRVNPFQPLSVTWGYRGKPSSEGK